MTGSLLKFFSSEEELEEYIQDPIYSGPGYTFENDNPNATRPIGAAIIFNGVGDEGGFKWNYTLRINASAMPSTTSSVNIFERNFTLVYQAGLYYYMEYNAFTLLQNWIDEGIMEYMIRYGTYSDDGTSTPDQTIIDSLLDKFKSFTTSYSKVWFIHFYSHVFV